MIMYVFVFINMFKTVTFVFVIGSIVRTDMLTLRTHTKNVFQDGVVTHDNSNFGSFDA